jgi:uncharacterized membrane protein YbhN (UPF0104 family)
MNVGSLALGVLLCFAFAAARISKWLLLLKVNGLRASSVDLVRSMLFALALGIVTPLRIGEVVAVAPFPASGERSKSLLVYLFDRVGELSTVLFFIAPAIYFLLPGVGAPLAALILAVSLSMPFVLQATRWRSWLARRLGTRLSPQLEDFLISDVRASSAYWLWSCFTYLLNYVSLAVFIQGFGPIEQLSSLIVLPVVTLSNLLTITVGGLGVREGLAALLSPAVGLTPEHVAGAFFLSFVFTRLVPGLAGLIWFLLSDRRPGSPGPAAT